MTATNHTITGSVFALATAPILPWWVILPVAFVMHFALDALPHFGQRDNPRAGINRLKWFLPIDASVAAAVLIILLAFRPEHWLLAIAAGIVCASPDLQKTGRFIRFLRTGVDKLGQDWLSRFHHYIQWGERLWGAWVELAWLGVFSYVLATYL